MHIKVNGEEREVAPETTLEGLVRLLALAPERLAVELNYEVVRRPEWPQKTLHDGDRVEIVHFVGGSVSLFCLPPARVYISAGFALIFQKDFIPRCPPQFPPTPRR